MVDKQRREKGRKIFNPKVAFLRECESEISVSIKQAVDIVPAMPVVHRSHDAMRPKERFSQLWQNNARVTNASSIYRERRYLSATMRQFIDALARAFINNQILFVAFIICASFIGTGRPRKKGPPKRPMCFLPVVFLIIILNDRVSRTTHTSTYAISLA